jgi:zinc and cadmium transporter
MFTNTFVAVILASFLACGVTTIGIYVISKYEQWGREHSAYFMCFAAGVLISVSFMHIIPKSFKMNSAAPVSLLVGFLAIHLSNRFLNLYVCHEDERADYAAGIIPMLGIGFHSFIDGIIYSVTFNVGIFTGVLAAIGMILHEFPEGDRHICALGVGRLQPKEVCHICLSGGSHIYPVGHVGVVSLHQQYQAVHLRHIAGYLRRRIGLRGGFPPASCGRKREQEV